jgi:hypothetical protein
VFERIPNVVLPSIYKTVDEFFEKQGQPSCVKKRSVSDVVTEISKFLGIKVWEIKASHGGSGLLEHYERWGRAETLASKIRDVVLTRVEQAKADNGGGGVGTGGAGGTNAGGGVDGSTLPEHQSQTTSDTGTTAHSTRMCGFPGCSDVKHSAPLFCTPHSECTLNGFLNAVGLSAKINGQVKGMVDTLEELLSIVADDLADMDMKKVPYRSLRRALLKLGNKHMAGRRPSVSVGVSDAGEGTAASTSTADVAGEVADADAGGRGGGATGDNITVEGLLEKLKLLQYHEQLTHEGYDTIGDLKDAQLEDLVDDCGLKKPHAKRILHHFHGA